MKCPTCNNHDHQQINLHSEGFDEGILECKSCHTVWSINHGLVEVVKDPFASSFLSAAAEAVEADDYCRAI